MSVSMLSESLANAGVETEVYTTTANGKLELEVAVGQQINVDGVIVTYFARLTKDHSHFSPGLFNKLRHNIKNFDIVHIHTWWNLVSIFSCAICLKRGIPVVLSPRGTLSPYSFQNSNIGVKWLIHRIIGKKLLEKCFIHVTSERERQAVAELFKPKSMEVLPNFVNLPPQRSYSQRNGSSPARLIFFSRIEEKKGLDLLIKALPQLTNDCLLTVAGDGDDVYIAKLKALALEYGVDQKIVWLGFVGVDKFDVLQAHDLFILPSYDENFGNAVIESLCVGTPVLISEGVGLVDYVEKNNLGWSCKAEPEALGKAINDILINGRDALTDIRLRAPGVIYHDFNVFNLVEKYKDMYKSIING